MGQERPNFFSGPYIERRTEEREDPQWLAAAHTDSNTQYVVEQGTAQLLHAGAEPHVALLSNGAALLGAVPAENFVLLGWYRGKRCLLADLPVDVEITPPVGTQLQELRPLTALLPAQEAGLLAYARALSLWRARHHHCGVCGSLTAPTHAGHCLKCTNPSCANEFFPRIDPAIIVLVSDGERALLGRQASWPARRYSTIAGFVEPGESLEDAVAREVEEETGVSVQDVRYHSSQPWPFPSSVMLGFKARAPRDAPVHIGGELEDARWFTRGQITSGEALAPPTQSISWRLIESWLKGED
jgi:NAD+ diphosphatase